MDSFDVTKYAGAILVIAGAAMLTLSLHHAEELKRSGNGMAVGWRVLFILVIFFLAGYAAFLYFLLTQASITLLEFIVSLVFCGGGAFVLLVIRMSVVSVRNLAEVVKLERQHALHDALTGLPNRVLFHERLTQGIHLARRNKESLAVMVMDLNRFKEINDTLGHHMGDQLLIHMAPRLRSCLRESDTVCRLGGDEFAAVLIDSGPEQAITVAKKIAQQVAMPVLVNEHSFAVSISIGIAVYPDHGDDAATLVRYADIAMYEAKRSVLDYWIYDASQNPHSMRRLMLINGLREAIEQGQLSLVFQPKVDVRECRICGAEALLRWHNPAVEKLSADAFILLAEQGGFMRPLTLWVFESVLRQMTEWIALGIELDVSINVSVRNLCDLDFPAELKKLLDASHIPPSRLILEITESSMIVNPNVTHEVLNRLSGLGMRLSIDDFGTGYSSLSYLKRLPASEVKIDKSFVIDMTRNEGDAVIVHATISLAHNMGYQVVAEGVESEEILNLLEILGCDMAQGFHICRPLEPAAFIEWVTCHQACQAAGGKGQCFTDCRHDRSVMW